MVNFVHNSFYSLQEEIQAELFFCLAYYANLVTISTIQSICLMCHFEIQYHR